MKPSLPAAVLGLLLLPWTATPGRGAEVADPDPARWADEIRAFAPADPAHGGARPVVFAGSSSFRLWTTLREDFPRHPVVNRGFGGSHLSDLNAWFVQVVVPLRPAALLVYEGDNDLAAGKSPDRFLADFGRFRELVRRHLPGVPVGFVAIKPSPSRAGQLALQTEANRRVRELCDADPQFEYLDVATPLLDRAGQPDPVYFGRDRLHLNANGYRRWREVIQPWLDRTVPPVTASGGAPRP